MIPGKEGTTVALSRIPASCPLAAAVLIGWSACFVAGCATTQVAVQWSDPEFKGRSLRGEKVLVVCDAPDVAMRKQIRSRRSCKHDAGDEPDGTHGRPPPTTTRRRARGAGAKAILGMTTGPDVVEPGPEH
jgi:hypothetical protein